MGKLDLKNNKNIPITLEEKISLSEKIRKCSSRILSAVRYCLIF